MKKWFCGPLFFYLFFIFVLFSLIQSLPATAKDFGLCQECHQGVLNRDNNLIYLHIPFSKQQCGECHLVKGVITSSGNAPPVASSSGSLADLKTTWLTGSKMADYNHGFLLPAEKLGDTLLIELHQTDGRVLRHQISVDPLDSLPEVGVTQAPLEITDLRVLEVKHGVFTSATIAWQTNVLASAIVQYGNPDLTETSVLTARLGRSHEVTLHNLKPDSTYHFAAWSRDIFGNIKVSEPMSFSTSEQLSAAQPEKPIGMINLNSAAEMSSDFKRFGDNYLLELTLKEPATVTIGVITNQQAASYGQYCQTSGDSNIRNNNGAEEVGAHPDLSSPDIISLEACKTCHKKRCTHPVDVCPAPGMSIDPEYPLLPNGRITCISCHTPHSSNFPYLMRKPHEKQLCIGCHTDKNKKRI